MDVKIIIQEWEYAKVESFVIKRTNSTEENSSTNDDDVDEVESVDTILSDDNTMDMEFDSEESRLNYLSLKCSYLRRCNNVTLGPALIAQTGVL
ncbi:7668_t:CDS:2 [Ambispora gerdemannii]|uniref:7668_t:CDS:1 n=1 Tax=Ambispora gerdemannii TaxID=144530 RepID=A0A9N9F1B0_9GLOM|nr:7668_t:CDS:2 [Ambispora gerdemannii]